MFKFKALEEDPLVNLKEAGNAHQGGFIRSTPYVLHRPQT